MELAEASVREREREREREIKAYYIVVVCN